MEGVNGKLYDKIKSSNTNKKKLATIFTFTKWMDELQQNWFYDDEIYIHINLLILMIWIKK